MARIKRMGEVYSSGDVTVTLAGMFDINPSAIEYGYTYAHEYSRGLRRDPRGWRMGPKEYEGKITLPLDVVSMIEQKAPNGDIAMYKPFPVNVVFANSENNIIHDIVYGKFVGNKRTVTGDGELENEFDFFITGMELNAPL